MKGIQLAACVTLVAAAGSACGAEVKLSAADEVAAFKAAGFTLKGKQWRSCDDPSAGATPGAIGEVRDINGDGRPEAVITEGGPGFCFPVQRWNGREYTLNRHEYKGKSCRPN